MGPPREHGGEEVRDFLSCLDDKSAFNGATARTRWRVENASQLFDGVAIHLQWGHRANTVERCAEPGSDRGRQGPSMGPPREHGGEVYVVVRCSRAVLHLQWGH